MASENDLRKEIELLQQKLEEERSARKAAELQLEQKSHELNESNAHLRKLNENLEKSVRRRTNTLYYLIKNLHAGILLEDENRIVMLANEQFCETFNISTAPSSLVGVDYDQSIAVAIDLFEDPLEFERRVNTLVQERKKVINELVKMKDGRVYERDFLPTYIDEEYMGHLWIYREITEQFNYEEKIRHSEEKYRGIMENMELGLLEVDNNHKILRAYDRFCDMTGYAKEELEGKDANELLVTEDYQDLMSEQDEMRLKGQQSIYEVQLRKKSGELIWVLIGGAPFYDDKGRVAGSIGIHYNITQRKNLENELREAREMAEGARESEKQFLANMSHEIRNPINAIAGLINLLYDTHLTDEQLDYLNNIKFTADILLGLISDILDLSKIEAGKMELNERALSLEDHIKALVQTYQFKNANPGLTFSIDIDPKLPHLVIADPTVINQILINLLGNAVKFTQHGTVRTELRLLSESGPEVTIECCVEDTGIGIAGDHLQQIFESFSQADNQTKLKYGGTGLGLSIVRQLVAMYQGEVRVESEEDKGSRFVFTLVLKKGEQAPAMIAENKVASNQVSQHMKHVLVVEDNKVNQQYLTGLLKKWGITYDLANNGLEAMEHIKQSKYDLILMDIRMPLMDGYETTIAIRSSQHNPNCEVPIIALTASALVDERDRAIAAGMNYHITKPFSPEQLLKALDMVSVGGEPKKPESPFDGAEGLDREYLKSFYQDDMERAGLMFQIFLKNIDQEIDEVQAAYKERNWPKLGALMHRIRPNFSMVGLGVMSEKMWDIEMAANKGNEPLLEKMVPSFCEEFQIKRKIVVNELARINSLMES